MESYFWVDLNGWIHPEIIIASHLHLGHFSLHA